MKTDEDLPAALEEFAIRLVRLTPESWVAEELKLIAAAIADDANRSAALTRLLGILAKGNAHRDVALALVGQSQNQQAPAPVSTADPNTILRRNTLLLDWFEREVNIAKS